MRTLFIVNPTAGASRTAARWAGLQARLGQVGMSIEQCITTAPGSATALARQSAGQYDLLVAVGGDGTVSEVADGLLSTQHRSTALAVVPFGTGNDYAMALGVATETEAITSLVSGRTRSVDVIEVQCMRERQPLVRFALLFAGVGIISETLRRTTGAVKRIFGQRFSYPVGLARALWTYNCPDLRVQCDGKAFDARYLFVGASNTEWAGGGMRLAPGAAIDDGQLNVNLVRALKRWPALKQIRRVCQGRHTEHPHVQYLAAREIMVDCDAPLDVAVDGELIGQTPARFSVRAKELLVRVP